MKLHIDNKPLIVVLLIILVLLLIGPASRPPDENKRTEPRPPVKPKTDDKVRPMARRRQPEQTESADEMIARMNQEVADDVRPAYEAAMRRAGRPIWKDIVANG